VFLFRFALFLSPLVDHESLSSRTTAAVAGVANGVERGAISGREVLGYWSSLWRLNTTRSVEGTRVPSATSHLVGVVEGTESNGGRSDIPSDALSTNDDRVSADSLHVSASKIEDCVVCGARPATMPRLASCGHTFCYYCVKTECVANPTFKCPRCGDCFVTVHPWPVPLFT
jgi:hypothetical protein